jgi:hypothetical protein
MVQTRILLALAEAPAELQAAQALQLYQMSHPRLTASSERGRAWCCGDGCTSSAGNNGLVYHVDDIIRDLGKWGAGVQDQSFDALGRFITEYLI